MILTPHSAPDGFEQVVRCSEWSLQEESLVLRLSTFGGRAAQLRVLAIGDSLWRLSFIPEGAAVPSPGPMITAPVSRGRPLTIREEQQQLVVDAGGEQVLSLRLDPWSCEFQSRAGRTIVRDNPGDIDGLGRPFVLPLGFVGGTRGHRQVSASFHLAPDEHLFGLGEKFTPLDKTGQRIVSWTVDAFGSTSERSHKNVPFLWSDRGYGFFADTSARIVWDLGIVSCQSWTVTAESEALDVYFLFAENPAGLLHEYADLTGHAPVPPKWTFGLWVSSGGTYRDRATIERLVAGLEEHDVSADVVHIDPWWMHWRRYCDFRWNESSFPNPGAFIDDIHRRGLKICLWEHPYISVESDLFAFGSARGYFARRDDGSPYVIDYGLSLAPRPDGVVRTSTPENSWNAQVAILDLTNPDACRWFQDLHRPLLRNGIDVFKTDFGEDIPRDARFFDGQTGATMHNLYPLLYNRAVFEVTEQEKGRGIVWSRSGTAGNQRYPVCWSGDPAADWESLACTIRGGLSLGMSGVPFWSNDIGGYRGMPAEDLYIRWAQFGLLCSHSRMHGDSPREPWHFGAKAVEIVRRYVRLRYSLFPYIYSCAHESSRTGIPVLRGMPLEFPEDSNTVGHDLQFMVGPWLLAAPVYRPDGKREIYFPAGKWCEYWTGKEILGPSLIAVEAPIDILPLYVRGGAILPWMRPEKRIPQAPPDPLCLDLFPSGSSAYTFVEDEGVSSFDCEGGEAGVRFRWRGTLRRSMILRFIGGERFVRASAALDGGDPVSPSLSAVDGKTLVRLEPSQEGKISFLCNP